MNEQTPRARWSRHGDTSGPRGNQTRHPLYNEWAMMKQRCFNSNQKNFKYYGGRGITVCDEWLDWLPFRDYVESTLGPRPDGHSLDRVDNDGNYEPGNIRWASQRDQLVNRRSARV